MLEDGVIKFDLRYRYADAKAPASLEALNTWRSRLWLLKLIGRQAGRYDDAGYGNVSCRIEPMNAPAGQRGFIISGTQTGELPQLDICHYCTVTGWDLQANRVFAQGPIRPSSESLTHGTLYDQSNDIRVIFHVHSPAIWQESARLGLACTDPAIPYGSPEMAFEVARLYRATDFHESGIFTMGGHQDGVIAFGKDVASTGKVLLEILERSQK